MPFPRRTSRLVPLLAIVLFVFFCLTFLQEQTPRSSGSSSSLALGQRRPGTIITSKERPRDWSQWQPTHPAGKIKPLPQGRPRRLPPVQADPANFTSDNTNDHRRESVRRAFRRSYAAYKEHAWLRDELMPVSGGAKDPFGGWAATLVDSLDTLWIMDLKEDFYEASAAVATLDWSQTSAGAANMFETTIRHLGGLLSAYDLSGHAPLLKKAKELGDMLYVGFDTPNRLPGFWLNFAHAQAGTQEAGSNDPSASPGSLCLEFTRLSQLTGDSKYYDATDRITRFLERVQSRTALPGMWPVSLNFRDEKASTKTFTLGALADSLYEYLPKMHALLGGVDDTYEKMYRAAAETAIKNLLYRPMTPDGDDILFAGDARVYDDLDRSYESQHLTCFVGGMFGLGGKLFALDDHVSIGDRLARGCGWAYDSFPTGIMPEIFGLVPCPSLEPCAWDEKRWKQEVKSAKSNKGVASLPPGFQHARDARYLLRPEAIESVFLLYRMTGAEDLREMAWTMFQSIIKHTSTEYANAAIKNVMATGTTEKEDSMESFWLAETLKYFYLIFSGPDVLSLDEWVFNTEAHPFKRAG